MLDCVRSQILVGLLSGVLASCAPGPSTGGEGEGEGGDGDSDADSDADTDADGDSDGVPAAGQSVGVDADVPFDEDDGNGVEVRADGSLTIGGGGFAITHTLIWIANSREGTVSKIDTRTHEELGRYRTGGGSYMDPSRTAVNRDGHVVVANRGFSSATRILASDCPDQNRDGEITTSTGGGDILEWGEDECVVWNTPVGGESAGARGTVVEERAGLDGGVVEFAWIGAYYEMTMWEILTETGEATGRAIDISPCMPYGAALGPGGKLWATGTDGQNEYGPSRLAEIDTTTGEVTQHDVPGGRSTYGITVDGSGDVWTGGGIQRYRPSTDQWDWPNVQGGGFFGLIQAGGIAADGDGIIWAALGLTGGGIARIDPETMEGEVIDTGGREHGVAVDFDGKIWGVDFVGSSATILDPETLESERLTPPFQGAYTYSDMTGFQTANATGNYGRYEHVFEGCEAGQTTWRRFTFDGMAPQGSRLVFAARTADDPADLTTAPAVPLAAVPPDESPIDLEEKLLLAQVQPARYLLVEVGMFSDDGQTLPVLFSFGADHDCEAGLE
ncbi:MAG: hypothetical protein HYY06_02625 [Deltaproteobacteria bacterium]|nr:hypothetical protein [Deltaproteobacteria bacterium]